MYCVNQPEVAKRACLWFLEKHLLKLMVHSASLGNGVNSF